MKAERFCNHSNLSSYWAAVFLHSSICQIAKPFINGLTKTGFCDKFFYIQQEYNLKTEERSISGGIIHVWEGIIQSEQSFLHRSHYADTPFVKSACLLCCRQQSGSRHP